MIDERQIRLAYYESSDGPRVMMFGPINVDLSVLVDVVHQLRNNEGPVTLHVQPFVFVANGVCLRMATVGEPLNAFDRRQYGIQRVHDGECSFSWKQTKGGWDDTADLIERLIVSDSPGHQYLTRFPKEDATVVVSKGEYGDDVIAMDGEH